MGDTSLRTPQALAALLQLVDGDHGVVHTLAMSYPDWPALVRAAGAELGWRIGPRGAALRLPATPQTLDLPPGVAAVTRYDPQFPPALLELAEPPVLIYVRGVLTDGAPRLAVGGAEYPTKTGVEVTRAAARTAAAQGVALVAPLVGLLGQVALSETVDASGVAVAVTTSGFGLAGPNDALLERVLAAGGTVVSAAAPGERLHVGTAQLAVRIAAALSSAVVLAEVGFHDTAGAPLARAAIAAGKFLIIPTPQRELHTAATAAGGPALANARAFSPTMFGSSPRIDSRVANGLSPADAVVSSPAQMAHAIALGCRAV